MCERKVVEETEGFVWILRWWWWWWRRVGGESTQEGYSTTRNDVFRKVLETDRSERVKETKRSVVCMDEDEDEDEDKCSKCVGGR